MCRLFASTARLEKPEHTIALVDRAMLLQMAEDQKHGWGISDGAQVWKSSGPYGDRLNWMDKIDTSRPIIGHVRNASVCTGLSSKEAHPFVFPQFIGIHNGSFDYGEPLGPPSDKETPHSDSYRAFNLLSGLLDHEKENGLPGTLNRDSIEDWLSRFYDWSTFGVIFLAQGKVWLLRDKIRKLHYMQVGQCGFVVMTSKPAVDALRTFLQKRLNLRCGKPMVVPEDTLFVVDGLKFESESLRYKKRVARFFERLGLAMGYRPAK